MQPDLGRVGEAPSIHIENVSISFHILRTSRWKILIHPLVLASVNRSFGLSFESRTSAVTSGGKSVESGAECLLWGRRWTSTGWAWLKRTWGFRGFFSSLRQTLCSVCIDWKLIIYKMNLNNLACCQHSKAMDCATALFEWNELERTRAEFD